MWYYSGRLVEQVLARAASDGLDCSIRWPSSYTTIRGYTSAKPKKRRALTAIRCTKVVDHALHGDIVSKRLFIWSTSPETEQMGRSPIEFIQTVNNSPAMGEEVKENSISHSLYLSPFTLMSGKIDIRGVNGRS